MENIEAWAQLLIQVPLVGVFIWYSLRTMTTIQQMQKDFSTALDRRDELYEARNQALVTAINNLAERIADEPHAPARRGRAD